MQKTAFIANWINVKIFALVVDVLCDFTSARFAALQRTTKQCTKMTKDYI